MRVCLSRCITALSLVFCLAALATGQTTAPKPASPSPEATEPSAEELYETGKQLFDQLAPPEIKAQFEFPSKEEWDQFAARLQRALEGDDLNALAVYAPEGRTALTALRTFPEYNDYSDW